MAPQMNWVCVLMAVLGLAHTTLVQEENSCDWLTNPNTICLQKADCSSTTGMAIYLWENCSQGSELFTVVPEVTLGDECEYLLSAGNTYTLIEEFDREDIVLGQSISCDKFILDEPPLYFQILNVNEFAPEAARGPIFQIEPTENEPAGTITTLKYTDLDFGETAALSSTLVTTEYEDQFEMVPEYNSDEDIMFFHLNIKKPLDFEDLMYYNLQYDIISTDEGGGEIVTRQTILVAVADASDNPPYWTNFYPSSSITEGPEDRYVFTVTARDRDVMINNEIKYSLFGNDSAYFTINESTGELRTAQEIDREALLEENIRSFTLDIVATEYDTEGNVAQPEDKGSSTQVCIINILDINNKEPTFEKDTYEVSIDELTSGDFVLPLSIIVTDLDQGDSGTYTLVSDQPEDLKVEPATSSLSTEVTLTALYINGHAVFDYEDNYPDVELTFTITATEVKDTSHTSSATIKVTLKDVNDDTPRFNEANYIEEIPESTEEGEFLLTVEAEDSDISNDYGKKSILYSLESKCLSSLAIDEVLGEITLISMLDYENEIERTLVCIVYAQDNNGTGNQGSASLTINVIDIVDEPPQFLDGAMEMEVEENKPKDEVLGKVTVTDLDTDAKIRITIDWESSTATSGVDNVPIDDIMKKWFVMGGVNMVQPGRYESEVMVGAESPDREKADTVVLSVVANDNNTEVGADSVTGSVTVTIRDVNDEDPVFESSCDGTKVKENSTYSAPGTTICVLHISDPDAQDTISLSIDFDDLVTLSETEVNTVGGTAVEVQLVVQEGAVIDREELAKFIRKITLTDLEEHKKMEEITIEVLDVNDVSPVMNASTCDVTVSVKEGEDDGWLVHTVAAFDADATAPFNDYTITLTNLNTPGDQNRATPFNVDPKTGDVTVWLDDGDRVIDFEQYQSWQLIFQAYDSCEGDLECEILDSEYCNVYVEVEDVNDNAPCDFTWEPKDFPLVVDESMAEGEIAGYEIWAKDDDKPNTDNTNLTYTVLSVTEKNGDQDWELFRAVDLTTPGNPPLFYCTLEATQNLYGEKLTGEYVISLMAEDFGDPRRNGTVDIDLTIKDANDETPRFVFKGCLTEDDFPTIIMLENQYAAGEEVKCDVDGNRKLEITVEDDDKDKPNYEVDVNTDMENSTAETPNGGDGQLSAFSIEAVPGGGYSIFVSDTIDRETGSAYNLSLHVVDRGIPHRHNWSMIQILVMNEPEFDPYFCVNGTGGDALCTQTLYMRENVPNVTAQFNLAMTPDNNQPGKQFPVYYQIVGGNTDDFELRENRENTLYLNSLMHPEGLDTERVPHYTLAIDASYSDSNRPDIEGNTPIPRNFTLYLDIYVQDENDNGPLFPEAETFASFTQSDTNGKDIALIEAIDPDLNETLTYRLGNDFEWHETDAATPPNNPFTLEQLDNKANLILNFEPTGVNEGYCTFTIYVHDAGSESIRTFVHPKAIQHLEQHNYITYFVDNSHSTQGKVYAITKDNQLSVYFFNSVSEIQSKKSQIEEAFRNAFDFPCIIDSISEYVKESSPAVGASSDNSTTFVLMHFIDSSQNKPVPVEDIENLLNNDQIAAALLTSLNLIDVTLASVTNPPTGGSNLGNQDSVQDEILLLKVLLGVVAMVLGLLVVLLLTAYFLRTRSLERKVRVLSTNTFGSQASDLNCVGSDMTKVPGSNLFTKEGANPMYNMPNDSNLQKGDTHSISSGDSVLVGVEDNPEFKKAMGRSEGIENPAFTTHSIDNVSMPNGGTRTNPLLQLSSEDTDDMDLSDGLTGFELNVRSNSVSGSEGASNSPPPYSNFSFAKL